MQLYTSVNAHFLQSSNVHEKLHHFCNIHAPDDGQKILGNQLIMEGL